MIDPYESWNPDQATNESDGRPDEMMVPYVEALRDQDFTTLQSRQGHPENEEGLASDGHLVWVAKGQFFPHIASRTGVLTVVRKEYSRYYVPAWEVYFAGMTEGEDSLRTAMEVLFNALGVPSRRLPPEHHD